MDLADAIQLPYLTLQHALSAKLANFTNLFCGQLRIAVIFASRVFGMVIATLLVHICHVLSVCTQRQMIRIATGRIITAMQHVQVFRDRAVVNFPRNTMGQKELGAWHSTSNHPISLIVFPCLPLPTLIRLAALNMSPESLFNCPAAIGMMLEKTHGLPLDYPACACGIGRNVRFLSTATAAIAVSVGPFLRRHKENLLSAIDRMLVEGKRLPIGGAKNHIKFANSSQQPLTLDMSIVLQNDQATKLYLDGRRLT